MALTTEDRLTVQDLMIRYAYCIDVDCTEAEWLSLFTEDAVMTSPLGGSHVGVEGFRKFRSKFLARRGKTQIRHVITNMLVDGEGTDATIKAYFMELKTELEVTADTKPKTLFNFAGSYDCKARKISGTWKLHRGTVHLDALP